MSTALNTSSMEKLAKYHHQFCGPPPKNAICRVLLNHPEEPLTFPVMTRKLISIQTLAPEHNYRKRTHDTNKKRVKVNKDK